MLPNRSIVAAATAALLGVVPAAAQAKSADHARKARHINGVVRSINFARHSVTVVLGASHRVVTLDLAKTKVSGNDGAVGVGDRVTVTVTPGSAAPALHVIGVPNGGTAGHGAAIAGVLASVDATAGTITLRAPDGDSPVTIGVTDSTIYAGPGGVSGLADLTAGDKLVVMTADVTADPLVALAVLDLPRPATPPKTVPPTRPSEPPSGEPGGEPSGEPGDTPATQPSATPTGPTGAGGPNGSGGSGEPPSGSAPNTTSEPVSGVIRAIDAGAGTIGVAVAGQDLTLTVNAQTRIYSVSGTSGTVATLANLLVGDNVKLKYSGDGAGALTAVLIYDFGSAPPPSTPSQPPATNPPSGSTPPPPSGPTIVQASGTATGPVTHVYAADRALSMYVPALGKLLYVAVPSGATVSGPSGPTTLAGVAEGDRVTVSWSSAYSTGVVIADSLSDSGPATDK